MGLFDKLNKGTNKTVMEGIDTDNMEFRKLSEFVNQKIAVKGFFFTKGKYGTQAVVVSDKYLINMPARAVEEFEDIKADSEMLAAVLAGKLVIAVGDYVSTKSGRTVAYDFEEA